MRLAVEHRVGRLAIGDVAVVIAAAAPHRAEAFAACRAMIDRLKASRADLEEGGRRRRRGVGRARPVDRLRRSASVCTRRSAEPPVGVRQASAARHPTGGAAGAGRAAEPPTGGTALGLARAPATAARAGRVGTRRRTAGGATGVRRRRRAGFGRRRTCVAAGWAAGRLVGLDRQVRPRHPGRPGPRCAVPSRSARTRG